MNWTKRITACMEYENQRHLLKGIPLWLIATADYVPDFIYWLDYMKANAN